MMFIKKMLPKTRGRISQIKCERMSISLKLGPLRTLTKDGIASRKSAKTTENRRRSSGWAPALPASLNLSLPGTAAAPFRPGSAAALRR